MMKILLVKCDVIPEHVKTQDTSFDQWNSLISIVLLSNMTVSETMNLIEC